MTISPDTHPDDKYSNVTEGDVAQRPEEQSGLSTGLKISLVVGLIALGAIGIYVVTVLFSAAVQGPLDEPINQQDGVERPVQSPEGEPSPPTGE